MVASPAAGGDETEEHPRKDWLTPDRSGDTARRVERHAAAGGPDRELLSAAALRHNVPDLVAWDVYMCGPRG